MNIGGNTGHLDAATHAQMQRAQSLLVRLYFSDELQRSFREDRAGSLDRAGVGPRFARYFPDVAGEAFQAESRGRRILIAREVADRYPRSLECLLGRLPEAVQPRSACVASSPAFAEFLASDYFTSVRYSLPHCLGLGLGYEAVSKFFFWLEARHALCSAQAPRELRLSALGELGRHLVGTGGHLREGEYAAFQWGVRFPLDSGEARPIIIVQPDGSICAVPELDSRQSSLPDLEAFVQATKATFPCRA